MWQSGTGGDDELGAGLARGRDDRPRGGRGGRLRGPPRSASRSSSCGPRRRPAWRRKPRRSLPASAGRRGRRRRRARWGAAPGSRRRRRWRRPRSGLRHRRRQALGPEVAVEHPEQMGDLDRARVAVAAGLQRPVGAGELVGVGAQCRVDGAQVQRADVADREDVEAGALGLRQRDRVDGAVERRSGLVDVAGATAGRAGHLASPMPRRWQTSRVATSSSRPLCLGTQPG